MAERLSDLQLDVVVLPNPTARVTDLQVDVLIGDIVPRAALYDLQVDVLIGATPGGGESAQPIVMIIT